MANKEFEQRLVIYDREQNRWIRDQDDLEFYYGSAMEPELTINLDWEIVITFCDGTCQFLDAEIYLVGSDQQTKVNRLKGEQNEIKD